jgi:hypothetical protein
MPNRTAPLILALGAALLACPQALAMSQKDDIDTNRPSFMDSPLVLPKSSVQLENGTLYHSGKVRKINRNNQGDLQYGFGLDRSAPVAFIGAGYSFRFDHFPFK